MSAIHANAPASAALRHIRQFPPRGNKFSPDEAVPTQGKPY